MQGKWLVCGGETQLAERVNSLHTFDFSSMTWSKAEVVGSPLLCRLAHMATFHEGAMVIMGGMPSPHICFHPLLQYAHRLASIAALLPWQRVLCAIALFLHMYISPTPAPYAQSSMLCCVIWSWSMQMTVSMMFGLLDSVIILFYSLPLHNSGYTLL